MNPQSKIHITGQRSLEGTAEKRIHPTKHRRPQSAKQARTEHQEAEMKASENNNLTATQKGQYPTRSSQEDQTTQGNEIGPILEQPHSQT